jgi:hypothetical protein
MKTAMQLLFEEFESLSKSSRDAGDSQTAGLIDFLCERKAVALEKEKEQIIDANISGMEFIPVDPNKYQQDAEEYYNQTYKQYGLDDEARQILNNL